jgi:hypothetical protein
MTRTIHMSFGVLIVSFIASCTVIVHETMNVIKKGSLNLHPLIPAWHSFFFFKKRSIAFQIATAKAWCICFLCSKKIREKICSSFARKVYHDVVTHKQRIKRRPKTKSTKLHFSNALICEYKRYRIQCYHDSADSYQCFCECFNCSI